MAESAIGYFNVPAPDRWAPERKDRFESALPQRRFTCQSTSMAI